MEIVRRASSNGVIAVPYELGQPWESFASGAQDIPAAVNEGGPLRRPLLSLVCGSNGQSER